VYRVEFDKVVAEETFGAVDELIKTLQGGLKVAAGECERIAIVESYCGKLMDTAIIAAHLQVDRYTSR